MQTGLGRFGIGKLGPHNRPVSQALPSLPTFVPGNTVAKRKPGRPRKEVNSESDVRVPFRQGGWTASQKLKAALIQSLMSLRLWTYLNLTQSHDSSIFP